jgi:small-conductance mechanosensitive channel
MLSWEETMSQHNSIEKRIGHEDYEKAKAAIQIRLRGNITNKIRHEKNADHVKDLHLRTAYTNITYKYLMLPIWISSFKYNDKVYQFMVNGQTGKVSGKTPVSAVKVIITILAVLAVLGLFLLIGSVMGE